MSFCYVGPLESKNKGVVAQRSSCVRRAPFNCFLIIYCVISNWACQNLYLPSNSSWFSREFSVRKRHGGLRVHLTTLGCRNKESLRCSYRVPGEWGDGATWRRLRHKDLNLGSAISFPNANTGTGPSPPRLFPASWQPYLKDWGLNRICHQFLVNSSSYTHLGKNWEQKIADDSNCACI